MKIRHIIGVVLVLFVAAVGWAYAQSRVEPVPPRVLSGDDLGFRITGMRGNSPVGTFVVRVNGEWVEVDSAPGTRLLTTK